MEENQYENKWGKKLVNIRIAICNKRAVKTTALLLCEKNDWKVKNRKLYYGKKSFATVGETVDTSSAVPIEVILWSEVVLTPKRIVQYKPNKIKVICENGSTKLIDNKEIKHIKYYLKNYDAEMKVYKVLCISYSAPCEEYHGYKYSSDDWVTVHRIREGLCEVVLVLDRTINEIIVK